MGIERTIYDGKLGIHSTNIGRVAQLDGRLGSTQPVGLGAEVGHGA